VLPLGCLWPSCSPGLRPFAPDRSLRLLQVPNRCCPGRLADGTCSRTRSTAVRFTRLRRACAQPSSLRLAASSRLAGSRQFCALPNLSIGTGVTSPCSHSGSRADRSTSPEDCRRLAAGAECCHGRLADGTGSRAVRQRNASPACNGPAVQPQACDLKLQDASLALASLRSSLSLDRDRSHVAMLPLRIPGRSLDLPRGLHQLAAGADAVTVVFADGTGSHPFDS